MMRQVAHEVYSVVVLTAPDSVAGLNTECFSADLSVSLGARVSGSERYGVIADCIDVYVRRWGTFTEKSSGHGDAQADQ